MANRSGKEFFDFNEADSYDDSYLQTSYYLSQPSPAKMQGEPSSPMKK